MAIRMRRGLESELDISKVVPGEWLVSTDTKYVRMCFAPGIVLRMATYEAFEADTQKFIEQIKRILSETKTVQEAVERIQREIEDSVITVESYVESAKGYSNLSNTYAMQSKMYSEESNDYADDAYNEAERAKMYAENASAVTNVQIAKQDRAGIIKGGENHIAEDGTLTLTKRTTEKTLYNSYEGGIVIHEIGGKSEQGSTTGAQLFGFTKDLEASNTGVTVKGNADGTLSVMGTATADGGIFALGSSFSGENVVFTLKAGNYFVSGLPKGLGIYLYKTGQSVLNVYVKGGDAGFLLEEDTDFCSISLRWNAGVTFNSPNTKIMLNEGTTAIPWEPFTGGAPSPNPDYPQDIKSVVLSEIKVSGKNLVNSAGIRGSVTNQYGTIVGDVTTKVKAGNIYTVSVDITTDNATSAYWNKNSGIFDITYFNITAGTNRYSMTFEALKDVDVDTVSGSYLSKAFDDGVTIKASNFQLEEGSVATPYEPYQEKAITLSNPITLNGRGGVKDRIARKDGAWGIKRKFKELVFNETSGFNLVSVNDYGISIFNTRNPLIETENALCNRFLKVTDVNTVENEGFNLNARGNLLFLCLKAEKISTVEQFNSWIATNNVILLMETNDTLFEQLPTEDQIALNSLLSFDTVTYLYYDSEMQPITDLEYGTSKVGAYTLETWNKAENNRINNDLLKNVILSFGGNV